MAAIEFIRLPDDGRYHVIMTVICEEDHVLGQWLDSISEKYPFYCGQCEDQCTTGKYPWSLTAQAVLCSGGVAAIDSPDKG
jgi:hypothetical protein